MHKILFAHPDQKLSQIYLGHMTKHFLVDSVQDGLSAVRRFKLTLPSLVISDYELPLLSGISLLKFIRSSPKFDHTPFMFLTNHTDNAQALSLGANDWLSIENSSPDHLLSRIYHHLKTNKYGLQIHRT